MIELMIYIIPLILYMLIVYILSKGVDDSVGDLDVCWFIPVFNILFVFFLLWHCFTEDARSCVRKGLSNMNLPNCSFLSEESCEEIKAAKEEYKKTIEEAKLKLQNKKEEIKQTCEKKKLLKKLGLTLEDLERIKEKK